MNELARAVRELRRATLTHRRLLAAVLVAATVAFGLETLAPPPPPQRQVLVAARDLAAGSTVNAADVTARGYPIAAVPSGALVAPADAVGRTVGGPVRRGEVLVDARLVGRALAGRLGNGRVAAPVRVGDASAVALLRPGDVVDLVAAAPTAASDPTAVTGPAASRAPRARTLASRVTVLAVPTSERAFSADGALLLVAVDPETALALAGAAVSARLSVVLRGP